MDNLATKHNIKRIFVEEAVKNSNYTHNILSHFPEVEVESIAKVEDVWGRVKKPYLQKRDNLNLFIGEKKGQLVKEAPAAYGLGLEKHYYFIHAYNCVYECQYCYLQGYFNTPDIVLFVNHHEIIAQMQAIVDADPNKDPWFHAGEFSDSLAMSDITKEWGQYWEFFKKNPKAKLEIRTKSVNTKIIEELGPLDNVFVSFTLAGKPEGKQFDVKCPSVKGRINSIHKLAKQGFKIGMHFDPIIYTDETISNYEEVIFDLMEKLPENQLGYVSIGVVRFTKDVYREVERNYPDSPILDGEYIKSFDNKIRYARPMRMWLMNSVKDICIKNGISKEKIYLCMEEDF